MIIVTDFSKTKLVSYLKPGMKVKLDFRHGLGDCVMFMPLYLRLQELYPETTIHVAAASGNDLFGPVNAVEWYDLIAVLTFHETPDKPGMLSKPEYCCLHELGIPFDASLNFTWKPAPKANRLIGVNFMCNSNSNYNVPYRHAKVIWVALQDMGMIPIEIYFRHKQYNCQNEKYDFVNCTTRGVVPSVDTFTSIMQTCTAFAGVNSGSLCMAMALYPERCLHLHTKYDVRYYNKNEVNTLDCRNNATLDCRKLLDWINEMQY